MLKEKYIEVWNKVDLIGEGEEESFNEKVSEAAESDEHPVILMSCKEGFNRDLFLDQVGSMSADLKGKQLYRLEYDSMDHSRRLNWLRNNAQLAHAEDQMEFSDDGSTITLSVLLDDVVFNRYLKEFEP